MDLIRLTIFILLRYYQKYKENGYKIPSKLPPLMMYNYCIESNNTKYSVLL